MKTWQWIDKSEWGPGPWQAECTSIVCACGCGAVLSALDSRGRERRYLPYHYRPAKSLAQRFWEKVRKTGACWLWQGGVANGYGYLWDGVKVRRATHVAWELFHGPMPQGLWVLHHCDVPLCVNAEDTMAHLFLGTHAENMRDRDRKGRVAAGERAGIRVHPEAFPRGSQRPNARLTEEQVLNIRRLYTVGGTSYRLLGKQFNVDPFTIRSIITRRSWRHLYE